MKPMDYKEENYLSILEDEKDEETNSFCCNSDEESDIDIDRDLDREFSLKEVSSKPPANSPFFPPPPSASGKNGRMTIWMPSAES